MTDPLLAPGLARLVPALATAPEIPFETGVVDVRHRPPFNPPQAVQQKFVGASYQAAYLEAARFVSQALAWGTQHGAAAMPSATVDFGSGWGRISRLLLDDLAATQLFCLDVAPEMTALVNMTLPGVNALTVSPMPPSGLRDGLASQILAFSVFSHLAEDTAAAWAREFARLLRPGGLAYVTVLDEVFVGQVEECQNRVRAGTADAFATHLSVIIDDIPQARHRFATGQYIYGATGDDGARTSDFYGWAVAPRSWMERVWGEAGFDIVEWIDSHTLFSQAMVCMRRR